MNLEGLRKKYKTGQISKLVFIKKMYEIHKILFDYVEYLKGTDIAKIEISGKGVIVTTVGGVRLISSKDDIRTASLEILNFSHYELNEMSMAVKLIKKYWHDNFTFLDIGGNIGWYAINLSKVFPEMRIHSFEPIPLTYSYLEQNIKMNGSDRVKIYNFGFSDNQRELTFYFDRSNSGNASLENVSGGKEVRKVKSKVDKVDNFVWRKKIRIDFIKCDVEGAEFFVFKGAKKTLMRDKPIILVEMLRKWAAKFNYHPNEIISYFKNLGYLCYTIKNTKLERFSSMDETTVETNFIFIHPDRTKTNAKRK